ncbi:hypothetical protein HNQ59_001531 [Chitinivorax tropicus]|uniref:Uncharacterized protein n=1 Tax=Chitinivorax tropicus TaxID=714531 RepID=A0A840MP20_9PROT|nr:hypothetical protein [Chitinivorax tropicus]
MDGSPAYSCCASRWVRHRGTAGPDIRRHWVPHCHGRYTNTLNGNLVADNGRLLHQSDIVQCSMPTLLQYDKLPIFRYIKAVGELDIYMCLMLTRLGHDR